LKPWRFEFGVVGPLCQGEGRGVPGLVFHVWTRRACASGDEAAGADNIPTGKGADDINYAPVGTPPTGFQQPHCGSGDITP
jgi:hypothetical protein